MNYIKKLHLSVAISAIMLSGCGGDSGGSSPNSGTDSDNDGNDGGSTPVAGIHTITGTIIGGVSNLAIEDTVNALSTHAVDGTSFELGKFGDGVTYSLSVDDPIGKKCVVDTPTGVINSDLNVVVTCNDDTYTPKSITVTSTFDRDGIAYIQLEQSDTVAAQSGIDTYNVMGRTKSSDDDFQLLGSGTLNSSNQLVIESLPSDTEMEIYVVPNGVNESQPELVSLVTNPPSQFYPGVVPTYMSDFQDLYLIESYYDDRNVLKVKFTPKNLNSMPDDWHVALESELLGTYLHGNIDSALAEVYQLTNASPQSNVQRSSGQGAFLGSVKEFVFEAVERTFVEIREFADLDFSFRLKSNDQVGKGASVSPFKSGLNCEFNPVEDPYQKIPSFKPPVIPTVPQVDPFYDIYVEGKLKIRDGEYLPNDMYLHMEGHLATQLTYGMKAAALYDGYPVAASCYPVIFRYPIPMPYFPAAKVGNFFIQTGAELVFGKVQLRGEYSITREFRYPFKTTIGVKDGEPALTGRLGSFHNEIIGSQARLEGKAEIESGIVSNFGLELSPGLTISKGQGLEATLISTGLKFGGKIAGTLESNLHVLINEQPLYSMDKLEIGSGPVAEIETKFPPFPAIKPLKKDWAQPHFKPWKDWALPSYSPQTNQPDLGAIQAGDNIDISLLLGSSGSDPSKVDYANIQWKSVPENTIGFSEFGPNRLKVKAIPIEHDAEMRQIVVTMSHIDGYEYLDKSIVMTLNVTSKACPSEDKFLNEIGRTKTDQNRVHIRPADATDPTQIGNCTVKLFESNSEGEWVETEATYKSGFLVNRTSKYQSGVISQLDTFEVIELASGAKNRYPTRLMTQSEDEKKLTILNYRNVLNSDRTQVFNLNEGPQINLSNGHYSESNLGNFLIPGTDNYQQISVGTQTNIWSIGTEEESQHIFEYGLTGLVCDDGSTVEKLDSHTFKQGTSTTIKLYKHYNCPNANYARHVSYLSEERRQFDYSHNTSSSIRTSKYQPIFDSLPYLETVNFNGSLSYVSETYREDFEGSIVSRYDYERYNLLKIPVTSSYATRPFHGFDRVMEFEDELYLHYTELTKYSIHDDDGNLESINEEWYEPAVHNGINVVVQTHDMTEYNTPEDSYLTILGRYPRNVTHYSGGIAKDEHDVYYYKDALYRKQYVESAHEFEFDSMVLDGETWSFSTLSFDPDVSFHYVRNGTYGTYETLGTQDLCERGNYSNTQKEGAYFRNAGCFSTVQSIDDVTEQSNYRSGLLHGDYSRRKGDYLSKGTYNSGEEHGWWRYYFKGNLTHKLRFDNGKRIDSCQVGNESNPC